MNKRNETCRKGRLGFTRTDLLATIGVVVLLTLLAVASRATDDARAGNMVCQFNLGRLAQAWLLYEQENGGKLTAASSDATAGWVTGTLDYVASAPDNTNTLKLTQGKLWPFIQPRKTAVYRCPEDASTSTHGGRVLPRVRSYSMNAWLNGTAWTAGYRLATNIANLSVVTPARTFVFLEEQDASMNDGMFVVDMTGYSPAQPSSYTIIDLMSARHESGANLSFGDGHAEFWKWRDARTLVPPIPGRPFNAVLASPNNLDVARMQGVTGVRR